MNQENVFFHHRSKQRIKDLGEVFTPDAFVHQMLDLLVSGVEDSKIWADENKIFFEPTCGHGNFVTAILERRLNAISTSAKKNRDPQYSLYSIANSINTIWAIDIDKKNVEECRYRALSVIMSFWSQSTGTSYKLLLKQNRKFFIHLLCAIQWHIHENEALSALSDEGQSKKSASKTDLGSKWINTNKHRPLDFELTWCEYFQQGLKHKYKVIEFERASSFVDSLLTGQEIKGFEEFSFALEVISIRDVRVA
ncbi:hypothetical protein [Peredibacter starrii]|uniref:Uncharacterized protein n=1 Tax=Peredibacter starrii TaxID=28202 RepID=A0AAX4HU92_9BACT|nr:hypothetical protein [Peredibacter starrii]WPU66525.1 hypothetical protein SOO65_07185 [Peredibacter starrii]